MHAIYVEYVPHTSQISLFRRAEKSLPIYLRHERFLISEIARVGCTPLRMIGEGEGYGAE